MIPKCGTFSLVILIGTFLTVFADMAVRAQELPPPIDGAPWEETAEPEDASSPQPTGAQETDAGDERITRDEFLKDSTLPFTGTLAEEDPSNKPDEEEAALFGDEGDIDVEVVEAAEEFAGTHLLKFDFNSHVQFVNQEKGSDGKPVALEPYMEIEYNTRFEVPVNLTAARRSEKAEAEWEIENWGSLAKNELFDCRLDIAMQEMDVEVVTRLQKTKNEEGEEEAKSLALKVDFSKENREDWWSFCTDVSGATLNTKGDTEDYNFQTLRLIEPSLKAIVLNEFNPGDKTKIALSAPATTINDIDITNDVVLSGEGEIVIEPL